MKIKFVSAYSYLILVVLSFFPFLTLVVRAASSDTVTATVSVQQVSVSLDNVDGISFGTIASSGTQDTTTNGVNDSTTATNDGNVTVDFNIQASDTVSWTLVQTAVGDETYNMKFCTTTCDTSPSWTNVGRAAQSEYATLAEDITASGTQVFDLQVGAPSTSIAVSAQSITVTVQASLPT